MKKFMNSNNMSPKAFIENILDIEVEPPTDTILNELYTNGCITTIEFDNTNKDNIKDFIFNCVHKSINGTQTICLKTCIFSDMYCVHKIVKKK